MSSRTSQLAFLGAVSPFYVLFCFVIAAGGCKTNPEPSEPTTSGPSEESEVEEEVMIPAGLSVRLPDAHHGRQFSKGVEVFVGPTGIAVGDEVIVELNRGYISAADRASEHFPLLIDLMETIGAAAADTEIMPRLQLYADQSIPYETVAVIYYASNQAGLRGMNLVVEGPQGAVTAFAIEAPQIRRAAREPSYEVRISGREANPSGSEGPEQPDSPGPPELDPDNAVFQITGSDNGTGAGVRSIGVRPDVDLPLPTDLEDGPGDEGTMGAPDPQEAVPEGDAEPPFISVSITPHGFIIVDVLQGEAFATSGLGDPIEGCPGPTAELSHPMTVCVHPSMAEIDNTNERLDYRGLYNRLVEIVDYPAWRNQWRGDDPAILFSAPSQIAIGIIVQTMDITAVRRERDQYELGEVIHDLDCQREEDECVPLIRTFNLAMPMRR